MKYVFLFVSSLLVLSCGYERASLPAAPSVPPVNYTITGTVRDSAGRAMEGVDVSMIVTTKAGPVYKTDADGHYRIRVTSGSHSFSIAKRGYRRLLATVRVDSDTTADFVLEPEAGQPF
jgi:hypothetical protein